MAEGPSQAHNETPQRPSLTRSHGNASHAERMAAEALEAKLWADLPGREKPGFFSIQSDDDLLELYNLLTAASHSNAASDSDVTAALRELVVGAKRGDLEGVQQHRFSELCNQVSAFVYGPVSNGQTLFEVTDVQPLVAASLSRPDRAGRHKPDVVRKATLSPARGRLAWADCLTGVEAKTKANMDLSDDVVKRVLRYTWHLAQTHGTPRWVSFTTLCGRYYRVWLVDHIGLATSRALDVTDSRDYAVLAHCLQSQ